MAKITYWQRNSMPSWICFVNAPFLQQQLSMAVICKQTLTVVKQTRPSDLSLKKSKLTNSIPQSPPLFVGPLINSPCEVA